jgi:polysaccharide export outer membrane protein
MPKSDRWALVLSILIALLMTVPARAAGHKRATAVAQAPAQQAGGASASRGTAPNSGPVLERRPRYRVQPGDVIDLEFPFTPEMNQTVTVQPDGYISLKGMGDFYAKGKTTDQLSADLEKFYGRILNKPVITVDLKNFQEPFFIVGGQVGHPGKYDLREPTTVIEALAIAGGFTPTSKHTQVLLFRRVNAGTVQVTKLNVKKMLHTKAINEDVSLRPGDMLYVPQSRISKIARFLPTSALSMYFNPASMIP